MSEFDLFVDEMDMEELRLIDYIYSFSGVLSVERYCKEYGLDVFAFARAIKLIKIEVEGATRS